MALDRQRIERKDFPIGRRGYDPEAVDAHLAALATEVDELKRSAHRRSETLAAAAAEKVRAIVEAAESSAAEIQRQAEDEAEEIRTEASTEARVTREQATAQARDYVGRLSESTSTMLQRLEAMESELGALIEALKTAGNRLHADLQLLESNLDEVRDAVAPRPRFQPEAAAMVGYDAEPSVAPVPAAPEAVPPETVVPEAAPQPGEPTPAGTKKGPAKRQGDVLDEVRRPGEPAGPGDNGGADDDEGARLVALNMALNGTPREETARYLADNFNLRNQRGLLDEVYASVGG